MGRREHSHLSEWAALVGADLPEEFEDMHRRSSRTREGGASR
ncbi:MAG: hypothetical protein ABEJ31_14230 [Haloarculaceae archaeon]